MKWYSNEFSKSHFYNCINIYIICLKVSFVGTTHLGNLLIIAEELKFI